MQEISDSVLKIFYVLYILCYLDFVRDSCVVSLLHKMCEFGWFVI